MVLEKTYGGGAQGTDGGKGAVRIIWGPNRTFPNTNVMDTNEIIDRPIITINGPSLINLNVGDTYTEQGATWTDGEDGTGNATISGDTVNTNLAGTYYVRYNYTDSDDIPCL